MWKSFDLWPLSYWDSKSSEIVSRCIYGINLKTPRDLVLQLYWQTAHTARPAGWQLNPISLLRVMGNNKRLKGGKRESAIYDGEKQQQQQQQHL